MNNFCLYFEDINSNKIVKILSEYGVCVLKNYFDVEEIKTIFNELDFLYEKVPEKRHGHLYSPNQMQLSAEDDYSSGKSVCFYNNSYSIVPSFSKLFFENALLNDVLNKHFSEKCNRFLQIFTTQEYRVIDRDNCPRNSFIHIDPFESLKFAIFYPDVDESNGSLKVIPKSFNEGSSIRKNFISKQIPTPKGYLHKMEEFPSEMVTFTPDQIISIDTSVGDLVLLNTDNYHSGGSILESGKYRKAIYVHNRP